MPVTPTYPGVYIEEIPSGVRTITGVATSITAFIGRALRGPVNTAVTLNSFADFERIFGGLWIESTLGYAVRDFYLNGGSQAVIVRLFHPNQDAQRRAQAAAREVAQAAASAIAGAQGNTAQVKAQAVAQAARAKAETYQSEPEKTAADIVARTAEESAQSPQATPETVSQAAAAAVDAVLPSTRARLNVDGLQLEAANEGAWGNALRVRVDHDVTQDVAKRYGLASDDLFNLAVHDSDTDSTELFRNVSVKPGPRQVDKVLENASSLVRVMSLPPSGQRPKDSDADLAALTKDTTKPHTEREDAQAELNKPPFESDRRSTGVTTKGEDGQPLAVEDFTGAGLEAKKEGLYALEQVDLFNLLCVPPYLASGDVHASLVAAAAVYCEKRRAVLLIDPPSGWTSKDTAKSGMQAVQTTSKNAALFFPRLRQPNPLRDNQLENFAPCGAVAGIFARTDAQRGVWKAPAGLEATLVGVPQLSVSLTDAENGELNPLGLNCLRTMPAVGRVVWGARTLQGDDRLASEWKYIPVRRLALYIEESLYRGTQWVVFEPNDEALWAQIRLNVGAFMHNLFRQGAFQGKTPREAYFVKCDRETTTQNDINLGIVNILVGFAPLKPAEFVIIRLQQMAGQIAA